MCQGFTALQCLTGKQGAEHKVGQDRHLHTGASHLGPWRLGGCVISLLQVAPSQELQSVREFTASITGALWAEGAGQSSSGGSWHGSVEASNVPVMEET